MNNNTAQGNTGYEVSPAMRTFLSAMSDGKLRCTVEYPNFRDVECEVIGVDFSNPGFKPIRIRFLEKLMQEVTTYKPAPFSYDQDSEIPVVEKIPIYEDWVSVDWLKNYHNI